ncbi:MAG: glycosyltransferase family 39 protein [Chloroflexi bacterium]|nr:glycosyltransferase family 39 protein [Chloroflexota bacterium]
METLIRSEDRPGTRFPLETWFLPLLTLLALFLRVLRLDFQPLWWDEGYSVWFATHGLGQMAALTAEDIHPPLYYALLHGWILLLGARPVALRLLSVAFGSLAVPAIYLAGRRLFKPRVALLAALLLALNPLHIFYSQEVRMYGLMALWSIGVVAAAWGMFGRGGADVTLSPRHLVTLSQLAYVLFTTAALYTQYYAIFLPIGLTVYALWRWRRDRIRSDGPCARDDAHKGLCYGFSDKRLLRWLGAQAAVALLYLPWVLYAAPRLVPYVSQKVVKDADKPLGLFVYVARHLAAFLAGHLEGPLATGWPAALVLLIPLGVGWGLMTLSGRRGARERGSGGAPAPTSTSAPLPPCTPAPVHLLVVVTLTALLAGWLIGLRYPFFPERGERLLLLALPPFVLLAATAVDALWTRFHAAGYVTLGLIGAVAGASLFAFYTLPRYAADDYRPLIGRTVEQGLPEDTVFCVYPWQAGYWRSYGSASGPAAVLTPDAAWSPAVAQALDAALARGHVWFPAHLALGGILETQIEAHLAERGVPFAVEWYGPGTRLSAWAATAGAMPQPVAIGPFRFPLAGATIPAVELVGAAVAPGPVPAANAVLPLALSWQASAAPPVLGVSVRLVDIIGQIWAQNDYEPLGSQAPPPAPQSWGESTPPTPQSWGESTPPTPQSWGESTPPEVGGRGGASGWRATDRLGLLIPAGTPPGTYTLEVTVHFKGDARSVDAFGPDGKSFGMAARITEITVAPAGRDLTPERLPIATRQPVDLGDGLRFLGYSADEKPVMPGELRKVSLFWQTTGAPAGDTVAFVQLLDAAGGVAAGWEAPPGAAFGTSRWAPGTLIRTQASFRPPATLPDGRYRLIAGLFRTADKTRLCTTAGADHVSLGTMTVAGRLHDMTPPKPQHTADSRLGPFARLIGYDLAVPDGGIAPGSAFPLTLYWQATGATDRGYTVFVHLLDETGAIRGYGDSEPGGGRLPTASWLPGEYLTDRHEVSVAPDAPPGRYQLAIGLYDPTTGQRLTTPERADRLLLEAQVSIIANP